MQLLHLLLAMTLLTPARNSGHAGLTAGGSTAVRRVAPGRASRCQRHQALCVAALRLRGGGSRRADAEQGEPIQPNSGKRALDHRQIEWPSSEVRRGERRDEDANACNVGDQRVDGAVCPYRTQTTHENAFARREAICSRS